MFINWRSIKCQPFSYIWFISSIMCIDLCDGVRSRQEDVAWKISDVSVSINTSISMAFRRESILLACYNMYAQHSNISTIIRRQIYWKHLTLWHIFIHNGIMEYALNRCIFEFMGKICYFSLPIPFHRINLPIYGWKWRATMLVVDGNLPALEYLLLNTPMFSDTVHGRRVAFSFCPYFHRRIRSSCLISGRCYYADGEPIVLNYQRNAHAEDLQTKRKVKLILQELEN